MLKNTPLYNDISEYYLNASSEAVLNYVSAHTETYNLWSNFFIERECKLPFWSKTSNNDFQLFLKSRARGYTNSYAPWLCGKTTQTEQGCHILIRFKIDTVVQVYQITSLIVLSIFTSILCILVVVELTSGIVQPVSLGALLIVAFLWGIFLGIKKFGIASGQQDKDILRHFIEDMIADLKEEHRIDNG